MPELPEVETIAKDLNSCLKGLEIIGFKVTNERTSRARPLLNLKAAVFAKIVNGQVVKRVGRRAKLLVLDFGGKVVLIHLKMTGQLVYRPPRGRLVAGGHPIPRINRAGIGAGAHLPNKFTRVEIDFANGGKLFFNDVRRFGWLKLIEKSELAAEFKNLGVEPLSKAFSLEKFKELISRRQRTTIKQALLEQKHLVGVGNIYADESLYRARVKPTRRVSSLTASEIRKLWQAIPAILRLAIRHRGTSFNDYIDASGEQGNFIKFLKVYGRAGKACKNCGAPIKKSRLAGRGTHWCDHCQR